MVNLKSTPSPWSLVIELEWSNKEDIERLFISLFGSWEIHGLCLPWLENHTILKMISNPIPDMLINQNLSYQGWVGIYTYFPCLRQIPPPVGVNRGWPHMARASWDLLLHSFPWCRSHPSVGTLVPHTQSVGWVWICQFFPQWFDPWFYRESAP